MVLYTCPNGTGKEGNEMIIKFTDHKYAQAHMEPIPGGLALYSYTTKVAELKDCWLHIITMENPATGELSHTTIRHIGWFMRELGFTYQLAKALYYDRKVCNIETGEVRDIDT